MSHTVFKKKKTHDGRAGSAEADVSEGRESVMGTADGQVTAREGQAPICAVHDCGAAELGA